MHSFRGVSGAGSSQTRCAWWVSPSHTLGEFPQLLGAQTSPWYRGGEGPRRAPAGAAPPMAILGSQQDRGQEGAVSNRGGRRTPPSSTTKVFSDP